MQSDLRSLFCGQGHLTRTHVRLRIVRVGQCIARLCGKTLSVQDPAAHYNYHRYSLRQSATDAHRNIETCSYVYLRSATGQLDQNLKINRSLGKQYGAKVRHTHLVRRKAKLLPRVRLILGLQLQATCNEFFASEADCTKRGLWGSKTSDIPLFSRPKAKH